jgi:hypothetical protein
MTKLAVGAAMMIAMAVIGAAVLDLDLKRKG